MLSTAPTEGAPQVLAALLTVFTQCWVCLPGVAEALSQPFIHLAAERYYLLGIAVRNAARKVEVLALRS